MSADALRFQFFLYIHSTPCLDIFPVMYFQSHNGSFTVVFEEFYIFAVIITGLLPNVIFSALYLKHCLN